MQLSTHAPRPPPLPFSRLYPAPPTHTHTPLSQCLRLKGSNLPYFIAAIERPSSHGRRRAGHGGRGGAGPQQLEWARLGAMAGAGGGVGGRAWPRAPELARLAAEVAACTQADCLYSPRSDALRHMAGAPPPHLHPGCSGAQAPAPCTRLSGDRKGGAASALPQISADLAPPMQPCHVWRLRAIPTTPTPLRGGERTGRRARRGRHVMSNSQMQHVKLGNRRRTPSAPLIGSAGRGRDGSLPAYQVDLSGTARFGPFGEQVQEQGDRSGCSGRPFRRDPHICTRALGGTSETGRDQIS